MQWNKSDMERYLTAKEYIDTIILELIPFSLEDGSKLDKLAYQSELMNIYANEITRELSGRTLQIPTYHYLKSANLEDETGRINSWIQNCSNQPFKHFFLITFDAAWKKHEHELNVHLLWLPSVHSEELYSKEMGQYIHEQVLQITELIQSYW